MGESRHQRHTRIERAERLTKTLAKRLRSVGFRAEIIDPTYEPAIAKNRACALRIVGKTHVITLLVRPEGMELKEYEKDRLKADPLFWLHYRGPQDFTRLLNTLAA